MSFFKKVFSKNNKIKKIDETTKTVQSRKTHSFKNSVKIENSNKKKKEVETLTCFGDGLGIQTKINY